jgi:hypothetical protein
MKILSIDVGIKNLAFCLFEKPEGSEHFRIKKWDVVNICEPEVYNCCFSEKAGLLCNKPAKFQKDGQCFCLKHSKKQTFLFPTAESKPSFISKQKIQKLQEIAAKYSIPCDKSSKKADLVVRINEYIHHHFFKQVETTNASKADLIDIGLNIKTKFNQLFSQEECIEYVIIENQISPIANRMKTIQGMIVQYFIMSEVLVDNFEFISAANKLSHPPLEKVEPKPEPKPEPNASLPLKKSTSYAERKKLGIVRCLDTIANDHRFQEHVSFFNAHKKKDDLADSFLQGMWFINNKKL